MEWMKQLHIKMETSSPRGVKLSVRTVFGPQPVAWTWRWRAWKSTGQYTTLHFCMVTHSPADKLGTASAPSAQGKRGWNVEL